MKSSNGSYERNSISQRSSTMKAAARYSLEILTTRLNIIVNVMKGIAAYPRTVGHSPADARHHAWRDKRNGYCSALEGSWYRRKRNNCVHGNAKPVLNVWINQGAYVFRMASSKI